MVEWSKTLGSGPNLRKGAWVRTPLLSNIFFCILADCNLDLGNLSMRNILVKQPKLHNWKTDFGKYIDDLMKILDKFRARKVTKELIIQQEHPVQEPY